MFITYWVSIAAAFMLMFALAQIMAVFFEKRRTSVFTLRLSYCLFFIAIVTSLFLPIKQEIESQFLIEILLHLIGYFAIALNYKSSTVKRIAVAFISYLFFTTVSIIITIFITIFFANISQEMLATLNNLLCMPLSYIIVTIFRRFRSIRKTQNFSPSMLVIPIGLLFIFVLWGYIAVANWKNVKISDDLYLVAIAFIFTMFCFSVFFLYDKLSGMYEAKLQFTLQAKEHEYYLNQSKLMQKSVAEVKAVRHDIKLHLATINGYAQEIHANKITKYVDFLLGEIDSSRVYSDTGNIAFDSILNFKLQNIQGDKIKLDLNLLIPEELAIDSADISTILGNLLDNALTAISNIKEKWLKIDIEYSRKTLFIQVKNSFDGILAYTENSKKEKRTLTSRKTESDHGFGLKNIKKSVEKYNGQMDVTHEGNLFSVAIVLYEG